MSKDGKTLISMKQMDLTRDPQAETMAKIDLQGRPVRGNKDAKVTVVVYDDFQCPYCSRMHQTLNDVRRATATGIKVVYKDFPLTEIHPWAERAAIDSECLAKADGSAYWDFAETVHANGREPRRSQPGERAAGRGGPDYTGGGQAPLDGCGGAGELREGAIQDRTGGQRERGRRAGRGIDSR